MSTQTKQSLEKWTLYVVFGVILVCTLLIQTIIIAKAIDGTQTNGIVQKESFVSQN